MVLAISFGGWIAIVVACAVTYSVGRWVCAPYYAKKKEAAEEAADAAKLTPAQFAVKQALKAKVKAAEAAVKAAKKSKDATTIAAAKAAKAAADQALADAKAAGFPG